MLDTAIRGVFGNIIDFLGVGSFGMSICFRKLTPPNVVVKVDRRFYIYV